MTGRIRGTGDKAVYELDGKAVAKEEFFAAFPPVEEFSAAALCAAPPHKSDGLAVHPDQVQEATESAKRKGVPTEFLPDGRPVMRSRAHQKQYLRAYGFYNRDGGYGD
jgi:sugar/nucleoside kinase (ribokinase family)